MIQHLVTFLMWWILLRDRLSSYWMGRFRSRIHMSSWGTTSTRIVNPTKINRWWCRRTPYIRIFMIESSLSGRWRSGRRTTCGTRLVSRRYVSTSSRMLGVTSKMYWRGSSSSSWCRSWRSSYSLMLVNPTTSIFVWSTKWAPWGPCWSSWRYSSTTRLMVVRTKSWRPS